MSLFLMIAEALLGGHQAPVPLDHKQIREIVVTLPKTVTRLHK